MKQHKAMIVALIVICITAVVAALVTRKDLCEVHIRTGQTEVAVFTAYEPRKQRRGVIPALYRCSHIFNAPYFYPGLPTGRLLGRLASQVVKKLLHTIKEAL